MNDHLKYLSIYMDVTDEISKYYKNSNPMFTLGDLDFYVADVMAAAILSATNSYLVGTRGNGKTLLAEVVWKAVMAEDALYLRGDKDLTLKDLFTTFNLEGKSEAEIYQISERIKHPLVLVDEINRCIGLVQNQFLNVADGYIEIRGTKYPLGLAELEYLLMIATGNPVNGGDEYGGAFAEDVALLDRMGLILNVDDYPILELDTLDIKEQSINKRSIRKNEDLKEKVFEGHGILQGLTGEMRHYFGIMSAYIFDRARYLEANGKRVDKTKVFDWRSLIKPGTHASGERIAWASDISQRALQENRLAEAILLYYKAFKGLEGENELPTEMLVDTYLETVMLNLRYNRRFLPFDYINDNHDGDPQEYLKKLKEDFKAEIIGGEKGADLLEECVGLSEGAKESMAKGNIAEVQNFENYLGEAYGSNPIAQTTKRILEQRRRKHLREKRKENIRNATKTVSGR